MLNALMNQGYSEKEAENLINDMCSNVDYDVKNGKSEFSAIEDELLSNGLDMDYEMEFIQKYYAWLSENGDKDKKEYTIDGVVQKLDEDDYNVDYGNQFKLSYSDGQYTVESTELNNKATYLSVSDLLQDMDNAARWMNDNFLTLYFSVKQNEVWTYNEQMKHKIEVYLTEIALKKNGQLEFQF